MTPRRSLLALGAIAAAAVPAVAMADEADIDPIGAQLPALLTGGGDVLDRAASPVHRRAVERHTDLASARARLMGKRLPAGHADRVARWPLERVVADNRRLKRSLNRLEAKARKRAKAAAARAESAARTPAAGAQGNGGATTPGHLAAIAACESGGNPSAVGGGGQYRGKYQFDQQTWQSVGGSGDPAAAAEAEQDRRAAILYSRAGSSPWPTCG